MHRIDGAGATPDNRFTDGDPASAVPATVVTEDWLNAVQEEIVSVILDPDFTPVTPLDKTKNNQLLAAIKRLISKSAVAYVQATESALGVAKITTQALTNAGADDATIITPKKLRAGVSYSFGIHGYISFPTWMGGFIFQWGRIVINQPSVGTTVTGNWTYPLQFPNSCFSTWAFQHVLGGGAGQSLLERISGGGEPTAPAASFSINDADTTGNYTLRCFAIGN